MIISSSNFGNYINVNVNYCYIGFLVENKILKISSNCLKRVCRY